MLALTLSACATQAPYSPPELEVSGAFRNAAAAAQRQPVPAAPQLASWWRGFNDPQLTSLVEIALNDNLDVAEAAARLDEARALARRAGAERRPGGSLTAQASQQRQSLESPIGQFARNAPGFERDLSVFEGALSASWELDLFGRLRGRAAVAAADAEERAALLEGVRIAIAAQVADSYLRLVSADERLAILDEQLAVQSRLATAVGRRFEVGEANLGERDEANAQVSTIRAEREPLTIERETQINRLHVMTGGKAIAGRSRATTVPRAPALVDLETPSTVFRRRPDIQAAERRLASSNARVGTALAEYYPTFSLSGLLGLQAVDAGNLFTGDAVQASAIFGLRWRLFDFARIDAEVDAARGQEAAALANYRRTLLGATEDVENALFELVAREREARELGRAVSDLAQARYVGQRSYNAGITAISDLLELDRRLLNSRQNEALAKRNVSLASVRVYRAIGGPVDSPDAL
ncbi:efflux transporter outer membrane subunit [Sphingomonas parva]|uniref:efflux transporter outer membrane subunit n=1 Tax=Sphingomonas parva TaxID=2555898 RepID=UPI0014311ECD|nr:efflux transporter outer membrane subunit [Sphingomonas parva]